MVNAWQTVPDPSSIAQAVIAHRADVLVPVVRRYFCNKLISFRRRS